MRCTRYIRRAIGVVLVALWIATAVRMVYVETSKQQQGRAATDMSFPVNYKYEYEYKYEYSMTSTMNKSAFAVSRTAEKATDVVHDKDKIQNNPLFLLEVEEHRIPHTSNDTPSPCSPYAYAFVLGGIHEDRPAYKGFLYDILISASLLRKLGSTADVWVWAQLSANSTLSTVLPKEDKRLFQALNIHVELLETPEPEYDSFAHIVYEKFRPLQMTQYRRVMFLDADAIPLVNLDYLFHLSDPLHKTTPTILRPNLIMASRGEPVNAGLFILEPKQGDFERVQAIVAAQRVKAKLLPYPHFDFRVGWGFHMKNEGDYWESISGEKKNRWRFHASHSDQGLLYFWVKYATQDVSIVIGDTVHNFVPDPLSLSTANHDNGNKTVAKPKRLKVLENEPLKQYSAAPPLAYQYECDKQNQGGQEQQQKGGKSHICFVPYRDFCHFMGKNKPWQHGFSSRFLQKSDTKMENAPKRIWFQELMELNANYSMGVDFEAWEKDPDGYLQYLKQSPLGYVARFADHKRKMGLKWNNDKETDKAAASSRSSTEQKQKEEKGK